MDIGTISFLHARLANTALFFCIAVMVWSFYLYFRRKELDSSYFGAVVICELLFVVQAVLGVILYVQGLGGLIRWVHILYGILALISIPAVYAFTRGRNTYYEALLYALTMAFLVGVIIRANTTTYVLGV